MRFIYGFIFCFINFPSLVAAQQLEALDIWESRRPKWKEDPSEISYVGARCGALFGMVGGYFRKNPGKAEDIEAGKSLSEMAKTFSLPPVSE